MAAAGTTIGVVGLGYVGLPLAVEFGKKYPTVGFDLSAAKVAAYGKGIDPTGEVSPAELAAATGLRCTTDAAALRSADFVVVAVPTPIDDAHQPDFGPLLGRERGQTIGGVLAANLAGSRRVTAGAARDHFLGFRAVTGRGEPFKAGGKVVKNVTGYDLPKLLAGSWGTLAVMTEVTIRVAPAPELDRTLVVAAGSIGECLALLGGALRSSHDVSAAGVDPRRGALLRLEGFAASVDARTRALCNELRCTPQEALEGGASRDCWHALASGAALAASPVVWRISVPPTDALQVLERLDTDRYLVDWGGGLVLAGFDLVDAQRVRAALTTGHATLLKAPAAARAATPVFQPQAPAVAAVAARVRSAFDPRGILNPGRMD